jgi:hypothetical protein
MALRGATAFETWLLAEQRHMSAASEAILHEAALREPLYPRDPAADGATIEALVEAGAAAVAAGAVESGVGSLRHGAALGRAADADAAALLAAELAGDL